MPLALELGDPVEELIRHIGVDQRRLVNGAADGADRQEHDPADMIGQPGRVDQAADTRSTCSTSSVTVNRSLPYGRCMQ